MFIYKYFNPNQYSLIALASGFFALAGTHLSTHPGYEMDDQFTYCSGDEGVFGLCILPVVPWAQEPRKDGHEKPDS